MMRERSPIQLRFAQFACQEPRNHHPEKRFLRKVYMKVPVMVVMPANSKQCRKAMQRFQLYQCWIRRKLHFLKKLGAVRIGVVFIGSWAGTDVAVKVLKLRNARRLQYVIETEVRVHDMIRHPNIVQIMAVSILKNSIYVVSEYINGRNLDEVLFGEGEESTKLTIQGNDKMNVARQISQAVAYLHNLKPPVVHRDIKPANVLIAKGSLITKLCDMSLSKLKTEQSLSRSTAIAGSPS